MKQESSTPLQKEEESEDASDQEEREKKEKEKGKEKEEEEAVEEEKEVEEEGGRGLEKIDEDKDEDEDDLLENLFSSASSSSGVPSSSSLLQHEEHTTVFQTKSGNLIKTPTKYLIKNNGMSSTFRQVFENFSPYEYVALVETLSHKKARSENIKSYPLDEDSPLTQTHTQRLRTRPSIPILTDVAPRFFNHRRSQRKWTHFMTTIFFPWDLRQKLPLVSTYPQFCEWAEQVATSSAWNDPKMYIEKCCYQWITNVSQNLKSTLLERVAQSTYKARAADRWYSSNPQIPIATDDNDSSPNSSSDSAGIDEEATSHINALRCEAEEDIKYSEREYYLSYFKERIPSIWGKKKSKVMQLNNNNNILLCEPLCVENEEDVAQDGKQWTSLASAITKRTNEISPTLDGIPSSSSSSGSSSAGSSSGNVGGEERISREFSHVSVEELDCSHSTNLKPHQNEAMQHIMKRISDQSAPKLRLIIHGCGGTGKSVLSAELKKRLGNLLAIGTPTNEAARQIPTARTYHLLLGINFLKMHERPEVTISDVAKRAAISQKLKPVIALLIDEVSMVSPQHLAKIDEHLRFFKDSNQEFGGLHVILVGDFFQIPPCSGQLLPIACRQKEDFLSLPSHKKKPIKGQDLSTLKDSPTSIDNQTIQIGIKLFRSFELFELRTQLRAAQDQKHMDHIAQFRQKPRDDESPVSSSDVLTFLQNIEITSDDVTQDPNWVDAPIQN